MRASKRGVRRKASRRSSAGPGRLAADRPAASTGHRKRYRRNSQRETHWVATISCNGGFGAGDESRNYCKGHPGGPSSTWGYRLGSQRASEACVAAQHHSCRCRLLSYRIWQSCEWIRPLSWLLT